MAIWQYSFWLVPKDNLKNHNYSLPLSEEEFNETDWFDNFNLKELLNQLVFLEKNTHWNKQTLFWGTYEGDSILITTYDENSIEFYIRIDLRKNFEEFLGKIIAIAEKFTLIFINEQLKIIETKNRDLYNQINRYRNERMNFFNRI